MIGKGYFVNIIEQFHRVVIGLLVVGGSLLLSSNVLASSGQDNGARFAPTAVILSSGPAIAADGDISSQSAEKKYAAYLPIIQQPGEPIRLSRYDVVAQRMLELVNDERQRAGCAPVAVNDKLTRAAQKHTEDMAAHGFVDHRGSDGSLPHERVLREGYNYGYAGESIAKSIVDEAGAVFSLWMNSPGHKAILLNCVAQEIGIGYSAPYWTLVLAKQL